jgi:hypothetical protein
VTATVVHPRLARLAGVTWLAAGATLVLAGVVGLLDLQRLGWEVVAGAGALALGAWLCSWAVAVDDHGIEQRVGWRRTRLLWDLVEGVAVGAPRGFTSPLHVRLAGGGEVVLRASRGLTRAQGQALARAAARHTTTVDPATGDPADAGSPSRA